MGSLVVVVIVLSLFAKKIPETGTSTDPYGTIPAHTEASETAGRDYQQQEQEKDIIMHATLHTNKGDITLELFTEQTPVTAKNFIDLAGSGFYDGVKFHRVIKGFMIQGGDAKKNGTGEAGYVIPDEVWEDGSHDRPGLLCMANRGKNTNSAQFFITDAPAFHLDGGYTIFGECGPEELVHKLASVEVRGERPVDPPVIKKVTITRK